MKTSTLPLLAAVLLIAFTVSLIAVETDSARVTDETTALRERQMTIVKTMQTRRTEMMKNNSELKRLQEEKFKIHRQIALILDADPELFELQQEFAKIDQQLVRIANRPVADSTRVTTDTAPVTDTARR